MMSKINNILTQLEEVFNIKDFYIPFNIQCLNKHSNNGELEFTHTKIDKKCVFIGAVNTKTNEIKYFDSSRGTISKEMYVTIITELQSQLDKLNDIYTAIYNCEDNDLEELLLNEVVKPYISKQAKIYQECYLRLKETSDKSAFENFSSTPKVIMGRHSYEDYTYKVIKIASGYIEISKDRIHYFASSHCCYKFDKPQHIIQSIWSAINFICK